MRLVEQIEDITVQLQSARRESLLAFGNDDLLIEQYIPKAKHIEFRFSVMNISRFIWERDALSNGNIKSLSKKRRSLPIPTKSSRTLS